MLVPIDLKLSQGLALGRTLQDSYCPNPKCPEYQKRGGQNLILMTLYLNDEDGSQQHRLQCQVCQRIFLELEATVFYKSPLNLKEVINIFKGLIASSTKEAAAEAAQVTGKTLLRWLRKSQFG